MRGSGLLDAAAKAAKLVAPVSESARFRSLTVSPRRRSRRAIRPGSSPLVTPRTCGALFEDMQSVSGEVQTVDLHLIRSHRLNESGGQSPEERGLSAATGAENQHALVLGEIEDDDPLCLF